MRGRPFYTREFFSSLADVGEVIKEALAALRSGDWIDPDQAFYARLCLEEALVNAVTHGNQSDARRRVRLDMIEEGDVCEIRVFDEGQGFSPDDIEVPCAEQVDGRGICLIRYCMDEVSYDRAKHCLVMRVRRKALCNGGGSR